MKSAIFRRQPNLDLSKDVSESDIDYLLIDRIADVTGWGRLSELDKLDKITAVHCGTSAPMQGNGSIAIRELYLHTLTQAGLKTMISMTNAEEITLRHSDSPFLDMAMVSHCKRLRNLFLHCGLALEFRHLKGLPLERVHVSHVEMNEEFLGALSSWSGTLRELWVEHTLPFGPDRLPALPKLEGLKVTRHAETRELWKAWTESRPQLKFRFEPISESSANLPITAINEIYRNVAIMNGEQGKEDFLRGLGEFGRDVPHQREQS